MFLNKYQDTKCKTLNKKKNKKNKEREREREYYQQVVSVMDSQLVIVGVNIIISAIE